MPQGRRAADNMGRDPYNKIMAALDEQRRHMSR
jgi:hypothetical protein